MDWYDTDSESWLEVVFGDVNSDGYFDVTADIGTTLLEDLPILGDHLIDLTADPSPTEPETADQVNDDDLDHLDVPFGGLSFITAPPW
jgi:hypothetical protein